MPVRRSCPFIAVLALLAACGGTSATGGDLSSTADLGVAADLTSAPAFGEPCNAEGACAEGLICLDGPNGGSFCSKTCPTGQSGACPGAPAGSAAYCLVTNANAAGDKGCAFLCAGGGKQFACPGALICQTSDEPPGSGQRLCLPQ